MRNIQEGNCFIFRTCIACLITLVLAFSYLARAADWAQYRGPTGDGISPDVKINLDWTAKPPVLLWSYAYSDGGWSNPCIGDGKVFVVDHVFITDPASGDKGEKKGEDVIRALDLASGKELWKFTCPGIPKDKNGTTGASPVLDDGKLYTISRQMLVNCLDAKTGKKLWDRDGVKDFAARPPEGWGHAASPLVDENRLIIIPGGADASVVALDKNSGETLWKSPGGNAGYATPLAYGSGAAKQYIAFVGDSLIGLEPQTGKRLWSLPWKTKYNQNSATPIIVDNRIFITSAWKKGAAMVDISKPEAPIMAWQSKDLEARFTSPVCLNGNIYGTSEPQKPGFLVCIDAKTGRLNWKQEGFQFGPIGSAGGALIVVDGKKGDVVLVQANSSSYTELGRIRSDKPVTSWNMPIVVDGMMFVRTQKALNCYNVAP